MSEVLTCHYPDFDSHLCEGEQLRGRGRARAGGDEREKEKRWDERRGKRKWNKRERRRARRPFFFVSDAER